jgi:tetratricopeptide (TPR) repeat protein
VIARILVYLALLVATGFVIYAFLPEEEIAWVAPGPPEYVGRSTCRECHEEAYDAWVGSHHDLAMDHATEETVLGDFDDATFEHFGVVSRFFRRDGRFLVSTDGPDGAITEYEVRYTFGVEPLQQYLIEFPGGRLQALSLCWDTKENRWFHLYPDEEIAHDDELHWTGSNQNWNYMCAECHSTDLKKNYDPESDSYDTTWSEIDVSCEACHGPCSNHLDWARWIDETDADFEFDDPKGLEILFRGGDHLTELRACAPCHSRRGPIAPGYTHGDRYLDFYVPQLLDTDLYYADGQILDEVYVYGSWLQSKMHSKGVACSHCHDSHSCEIRLPDNQICQRCHKEEPPTEFETLKSKEYDTKEHHFHEMGKEGSACVDCHMPPRNYMVVDPRHDHSMLIPRPELTRDFGIPNACNECHKDKTPEWSLEYLAKWYPKEEPDPPHVGAVFAPARAGDVSAVPGLMAIARDPEQYPIRRATAVRLMQRFPVLGVRETIVEATKDAEPLVRYAAVEAVEAQFASDPQRQLEILRPLLTDSVRTVRVTAARVLSAVPPKLFPFGGQFEELKAALAEYEARQETIAERPESRLNLAVIRVNQGRDSEAEELYRAAIRMDPRFLPARFNLANFYNARGRNREAEQQLREVIEVAPENGEGYYSLGLLLAELNRLEEAADMLANAAQRLPDRPRVHYNLALALQHLGRRGEAEKALLRAAELSGVDAGILHAVVIFYAQNKEWDTALPFARRLAAIQPAAQPLLEQVEAAANG